MSSTIDIGFPARTELPARFRPLGPLQLDDIARRYNLPTAVLDSVRLLSLVIPFRVNDYVLDELIDWSSVPDDPIFRLVFPQDGMLSSSDVRGLAAAASGPRSGLQAEVGRIRAGLNPHPAGQMEYNVPYLRGLPVDGMQHKYRETVLHFPSQGQACHAYCTYCFRWAQFIGDAELRFAATRPTDLIDYLHCHPEVEDVLVTGGDPMLMSEKRLREHVLPLCEVESVRTIRIGTKSVSYWPHRFIDDPDADDVLRLLERVISTGRTVAVMTHFSHPRELSTPLAVQALSRIRSTGAVVYGQAPLVAGINDDAAVLEALWRTELSLGCLPYYLFVERDTGPYEYFKVPLARAAPLFAEAYRKLPGLARTVRGPVMSAVAGKIIVDGVEEVGTDRYFALRLLQARDPALVGRPFRAKYSASAGWADELTPAPGTPADLARALTGEVEPG
jgi:KamA family protein